MDNGKKDKKMVDVMYILPWFLKIQKQSNKW